MQIAVLKPLFVLYKMADRGKGWVGVWVAFYGEFQGNSGKNLEVLVGSNLVFGLGLGPRVPPTCLLVYVRYCPGIAISGMLTVRGYPANGLFTVDGHHVCSISE